MTEELGSRHRNTLLRLFEHPAGGNIDWREVKSLLESLGAVSDESGGALTVTLGDETDVLRPPRGKDVDAQMIVDLRRMLTSAGFSASSR